MTKIPCSSLARDELVRLRWEKLGPWYDLFAGVDHDHSTFRSSRALVAVILYELAWRYKERGMFEDQEGEKSRRGYMHRVGYLSDEAVHYLKMLYLMRNRLASAL